MEINQAIKKKKCLNFFNNLLNSKKRKMEKQKKLLEFNNFIKYKF
jgi:hypothetical protein